MTLGTKLRRTRRQNKMTLMDVKEKTGISVQHLSMIENDVKSPGFQILQRIAQVYNMTSSDLILGIDEEASPYYPEGFKEFIEDPETEIDEDDRIRLLQVYNTIRGKKPTTKREWYGLYACLSIFEEEEKE